MNKTISLAAIALVAVVMGMSAIAPAMAIPNDDHNPKFAICHFDKGSGLWEADKMVNIHAWKAHSGHGDQKIDDDETPVDGTISTDDCLARNEA